MATTTAISALMKMAYAVSLGRLSAPAGAELGQTLVRREGSFPCNRPTPMCKTTVRRAQHEDRLEWSRMRITLWPDCPLEQHVQEIEPFFADLPSGWAKSFIAVAAFVAVRPTVGLCGFSEVSIRSHVEDCETSPVGYIEGWFVDADMQRQGIGRVLMTAAEQWTLEQGCAEVASDTEICNTTSLEAHKSLGFEVTSNSVGLRKRLS